MSSLTYPPVRVDATLQEPLSRWLWLVKWLLAIPHYIVLAFLWLAFVVLSVVAFVAILVTGRYPRAIFDFNVGVLRWSWRVGFYAYGGLGTDRYPPFSLDERPDYPAHLEIAYPDHLSRGLVLVKWWLLAIPHYLVIGFFLSSGWYAVSTQGDEWTTGTWGSGLIGLLVLVAAVVLLFTGRYPRSIFDLVLGLNRWVLRVAAYAALMTDQYPPFRLDLGGADPGSATLSMGAAEPYAGPPAGVAETSAPTEAPAPPAAGGAPMGAPAAPPPTAPPPGAPPAAGPPRAPSRWGAGRVIAVIVSAVLLLISFGLLAGAAALGLGGSIARDSDGYLMSPDTRFDSPGYAVTTENVELQGGSATFTLPEKWLGTVKVEADPRTADGVFVGIARTSDVLDYLDGVAHSTVTDAYGEGSDRATTSFTDGDSPRRAPNDVAFWAASTGGRGSQTLTWKAAEGDWTLVVMNAAGTAPVDADVSIGATVPVLDDIALWLLVSGLVLLGVSGLVLFAAIRRPTPPATPPAPSTPGAPAAQ